MRGTGGGAGEELTIPEQRALDCMSSRGSHLINGIAGGFESSVNTSRSSSSFTVSVSVTYYTSTLLCFNM